jgi:hypothetical protein
MMSEPLPLFQTGYRDPYLVPPASAPHSTVGDPLKVIEATTELSTLDASLMIGAAEVDHAKQDLLDEALPELIGNQGNYILPDAQAIRMNVSGMAKIFHKRKQERTSVDAMLYSIVTSGFDLESAFFFDKDIVTANREKLKKPPAYSNQNDPRMLAIIEKYLHAGFIEKTTYSQLECVSNVFVVEKNQKIRKVVDFRPLNEYIKVPSFPMVDVLEPLLHPNLKYYYKIDLRNAFHHIALTQNSRKYFGFFYNNQYY